MGMRNVIVNEESIEVVLVINLHRLVHIDISRIHKLFVEVRNLARYVTEVHI